MKSFREWLREKELNESPTNLGDMVGLQSKEDFKEKVLSNFSEIDIKERNKAKKIFKGFNIYYKG